MTKFIANLSSIALAAAAFTAAALPAHAQSIEGDAASSVKVDFSDLNLASSQGMDRLHSRIAEAAGRVCGSDEGPTDLSRAARIRSCVNQAIAGANAQVAAVSRSNGERVAMITGTGR